MSPAASYEHSTSGGRIYRLLSDAAAPLGLEASLEFNLGVVADFRVPDIGVHRGNPSGNWLSTAAIVVEVRSPNDESFEKFGFYFDHGVEEILVADLATETVRWHVRSDVGFDPAEASVILNVTNADVAAALRW